MNRIVLNATLLDATATFRSAGVSQYMRRTLRGLARAAAAQPAAWDLQAFVTDPGDPVPGIRWRPVGAARHGRGPRVAWEQTGLPWALQRMQPDLFHGLVNVLPAWGACPSVVTVLDLSFERTPDAVPLWRRQYLRTMVRRSAQTACRVVAISQTTADDLHRFYGIAEERITVIPVPVDPALGPRDPGTDHAVLARLGLSGPYFLHLGTVEPRKNLRWLVEAFADWHARGAARRVGAAEMRLVLAGDRGWESPAFYDRLQAEDLRARVLLLGYVPAAQLGALYRSARACLFPSRWEGFGMPVIEAMACGTPVICSRIPAFQEVARAHALFFTPDSPRQLQELMSCIVQEDAVRQRLRTTALHHTARFGEVATGQALLQVYREVLQGRARGAHSVRQHRFGHPRD